MMLVSAVLLFARFPLVLLVQRSSIGVTWSVTSALQVALALAGAHWMFEARNDDRARAQALCAWGGATSVVLAVVGFLSTILVTLLVWFLGAIPCAHVD
jgi:hypothetical protein